jgi:hypothetical protein
VGAVCGGALLVFEGALLYSHEVQGFSLDTRGPLHALLAVGMHLMPALIGRALFVYMLAGAVVAALARVLVVMWQPRWPRLFMLGEAALLVACVAWHRAITRPALFGDWTAAQPLVRWLAAHGQPWHPALIAVMWLAAHVWRAASRQELSLRWLWAPALGLLAAFVPLRSRATEHPLFVVIGIDALRPDALAVTPHLREFLGGAVQFDNAYTSLAQTEPAWRSLLTSRWSTAHGVRYPLVAEEFRVHGLPEMQDIFAAHGYQTAFTTDCSRFNYQTDFSVLSEPPRGASNFLLEKMRFVGLGLFADNALLEGAASPWVANRAIAGLYDPLGYARRRASELVSLARKGPLLSMFHLTATHFPGDVVFPFSRKLSAEAPLTMPFAPVERDAAGVGDTYAKARYLALAAEADAQLGILLDELRRAGLYEQATIVVFSDHGEDFYDDVPALAGRTPVHGARLGRDENQIVLAIKRGHTAAHTRDFARLLDVAPTLLELANLPPLPNADGASLAPALRGEPLPERLLYAETGFTHVLPNVFLPGHFTQAPRRFESYLLRADGSVEVDPALHAQILAEKDIGAFDGTHWLVRSPLIGGGTQERCDGNCEALGAFVERVANH